MPDLITGRIFRATGGFYSVATPLGDLECRARGLFRKEGRSPLVGDLADVLPAEDGTGTVVGIHDRKNELVRPPLANLDCMVVVLSVSDPRPNLYVVDKYLAVLEYSEIDAVIVITKTDLRDPDTLASLYRAAGYTVYTVSSETGEGLAALKEELAGKFCAFSGNSGVGKSSLLSALDPRFSPEVGDVSKKLGRGRHTTRHVEIYPLDNGAYLADTPGFSSVETVQMSAVDKESLPHCFRDFAPLMGQCRFTDCSHTREKGCAVLEALEQGEIAPSRHNSYMMMYEEVKGVREWEKQDRKSDV